MVAPIVNGELPEQHLPYYPLASINHIMKIIICLGALLANDIDFIHEVIVYSLQPATSVSFSKAAPKST